jgi:hypothetical protein
MLSRAACSSSAARNDDHFADAIAVVSICRRAHHADLSRAHF